MSDVPQSTNNLTTETVTAAAETKIFDSKGNKVSFGDLFSSSKAVVVFIRHFFCGICQAYVTQLAAVPDTSLSEANVKLVVIGCGEWQLIDGYKKETGFKGDIYADPSRELYHKLGMTTENLDHTPAGQAKRSYVSNYWWNALKSTWKVLVMHPLQIGKQGKFSQLGGDFVLGPGHVCHFSHLMQHTEDHVEVSDLLKTAGVSA